MKIFLLIAGAVLVLDNLLIYQYKKDKQSLTLSLLFDVVYFVIVLSYKFTP
jgi:hypothetical protein